MSIMKEELYQAREAFAIPKGRSYLKLLDHGFVSLENKVFMKQ